ncbi:YbaB/EbfC family nucleoid-associated protein [Actinoplanes palleronii]|uniref:YbaB/EbfC DNA-binding family protein n=1 Tax=Actinoplanes palleronii TaxID=113570 RepID=A0ABQ4BRN2_9ACTN|nr:YbaB/EbfC family nucleoid-associated protein [Actinoplanes palleronii]GIE73329.1 hypothetical protein Apa02nite_094370 [Actinoplanes palleronii]
MDESGAVTVTVDTEGRVVAVTVVPDWRNRLDAESLSAAVVAAVQDALLRRLGAWGSPTARSRAWIPAR